MGRRAVESASKLLAGQPVPADQRVKIDLVRKNGEVRR
jgi:hypothetical protein